MITTMCERRSSVVNSSVESSVFSAKSPTTADMIVIGVANEYSGASTPLLNFRVLVQIIPEGAFWEISSFSAGSKAAVVPTPLSPGEGFLGSIEIPAAKAVKVLASRTGTVDVPVNIEVRFMNDSEGSKPYEYDYPK